MLNSYKSMANPGNRCHYKAAAASVSAVLASSVPLYIKVGTLRGRIEIPLPQIGSRHRRRWGGIVFITTPIWSLWAGPPGQVLTQEYNDTVTWSSAAQKLSPLQVEPKTPQAQLVTLSPEFL